MIPSAPFCTFQNFNQGWCIKTPSSASLVLIFQLLVSRPHPNAQCPSFLSHAPTELSTKPNSKPHPKSYPIPRPHPKPSPPPPPRVSHAMFVLRKWQSMHREGSGPCSSFKLQPLKDANFTTDTAQELEDIIYMKWLLTWKTTSISTWTNWKASIDVIMTKPAQVIVGPCYFNVWEKAGLWNGWVRYGRWHLPSNLCKIGQQRSSSGCVCAREGSRGGNICQLGLLAAFAFGPITALQNNGDFISESSILYPPTAQHSPLATNVHQTHCFCC